MLEFMKVLELERSKRGDTSLPFAILGPRGENANTANTNVTDARTVPTDRTDRATPLTEKSGTEFSFLSTIYNVPQTLLGVQLSLSWRCW